MDGLDRASIKGHHSFMLLQDKTPKVPALSVEIDPDSAAPFAARALKDQRGAFINPDLILVGIQLGSHPDNVMISAVAEGALNG